MNDVISYSMDFTSNVEINSKLHWFSFASLGKRFRKETPLSQPIKCKTKTNHALVTCNTETNHAVVTCIFLLLRQFPYLGCEFVLLHAIFSFKHILIRNQSPWLQLKNFHLRSNIRRGKKAVPFLQFFGYEAANTTPTVSSALLLPRSFSCLIQG